MGIFPTIDVSKRLDEAHSDLRAIRAILEQQLFLIEELFRRLEK